MLFPLDTRKDGSEFTPLNKVDQIINDGGTIIEPTYYIPNMVVVVKRALIEIVFILPEEQDFNKYKSLKKATWLVYPGMNFKPPVEEGAV